MKRSPIILSGTALGLVGVLGYHASAKPSTLASTSSATTKTRTTSTSSNATSKSSTASKSSSAQARSATGDDVTYRYGDLQVIVTMSGSRITNVSIAQLNESDAHSQMIDQSAIPQLERETVSAQSAKIDAISGASYTSQAYEQSLQSALDKLGATSTAS